MFDRMSDEDTQKYHGALFTALNNLDNGEVARWYSDTTGNYGTVEIMATMPNGGILCRRVYVVIVTEKGKKNYESWACQEANGSWNFSYK
jgi:surface antigen